MCQARSLQTFQIPFSSPQHTLLQPDLSHAPIKAIRLLRQHPCTTAWEVLPQRERSLTLLFVYLLLPHLLLTQSHSLILLRKRALNDTTFYSILRGSVHFFFLWHEQNNIVYLITTWSPRAHVFDSR